MKKKHLSVSFVVSVNPAIGYGHLYRCTELAKHFIKRSVEVFFLIPKQDKAYIENIQRGIAVRWLNDFSADVIEQELVKNFRNSIVLIDSYLHDKELEKKLKQNDFFVVAVDDLGREHEVDIVVDSCMGATTEKYLTSINIKKILAGSRYSIIRDEFNHQFEFDYKKVFCGVLIFLGTSTKELTLKLLKSVRALNPETIMILAPMQAGFDESLLKENESIIYNCNDMLSLYKTINLCFGACGVSQVERFALGVPSVCFKTIENQENNAAYIFKNNLSPMLGDLNEVDSETLTTSILELQKLTSSDWEAFCIRAKGAVNLNGARLVTESIIQEFEKANV